MLADVLSYWDFARGFELFVTPFDWIWGFTSTEACLPTVRVSSTLIAVILLSSLSSVWRSGRGLVLSLQAVEAVID